MKKVRSDDPRFGKAVRSLSKSARTIADALDIPVNIRKELSCDEIRQICHALLEGLVAASQVSIGSEIRSIFGESKSDLGAQFRLGLTGEAPMTLQEAGNRVGVSRERVRQKQEKIDALFSEGRPYTPVLDKGLRIIQDLMANGVDDRVTIEGSLREAAVLTDGDTVRELIAFGALKGGPVFSIYDRAPIDIILRGQNAEGLIKAIECVRRTAIERTRDFGACHVDAFVTALESEGLSEWAVRVPMLLSAVDDVEWLEEGSWLRVKRKWNRIANHARKVFSVSPRIRVADLRRGLMRSHRIGQVPPRQVLGQLLVRELPDLGITFDGECLTATEPQRPEDVLAPLELQLYTPLAKAGGVMSREALESAALAGGMNFSSFHVMLGYSAIIDRLVKGVYALRGAAIAPGVVETLAPKGSFRQAAVKDFGHQEDGSVWLVQKASAAVIKTGTLTLPTPLKPYLKGQYCLLVDGKRAVQEASVSSGQVRLPRRMLAIMGTEPDDFVLLKFSPKEQTVAVSVGDESIVDRPDMASSFEEDPNGDAIDVTT
jgi:hypothetical protein